MSSVTTCPLHSRRKEHCTSHKCCLHPILLSEERKGGGEEGRKRGREEEREGGEGGRRGREEERKGGEKGRRRGREERMNHASTRPTSLPVHLLSLNIKVPYPNHPIV